MRDTFRFGPVGGVVVGMNWSLIAVAALLTFGLAGGRFPGETPGYSTTAYVIAGLVTAALFLASVLLHELSHSLMAQREGMEVDGISLSLLGGVTRIEGETASPAAEVRISAAGPLASLVLGGGLLAVAVAGDRLGVAPLAVEVATWLATINLILAVFNVLPGAPLDGGRLVHAFVWWRTGDRFRATVAASRAGRVLGVVLTGAGFLVFAATGTPDGLWMVVVGWFLAGAARSEQSEAALRRVTP